MPTMESATSKNPPRFDRVSGAILDAAARVLAEDPGANLASVAAAAGVSRATLYRYYANRDALLDALTADALADITHRLADAGLDHAPIDEAIERIMRAIVAVGDRVAMLLSDHTMLKQADAQLAPPIQQVLGRGIADGALRDDLPVEILWTFFTCAAVNAIKLTQHHRLGREDASAAAAGVFLNGARRQE
jgi:AcrR family transcriptional regulator